MPGDWLSIREYVQDDIDLIHEMLANRAWSSYTDINPGDYINYASEYDAWLHNLAEEDYGGVSRGAPPAARSAIEALETFEVGSSDEMVCAVCQDEMVLCEIGKKLPCGHCYHGDCILPWLRTRNSCPLCRFQLQTDDPQYERARRDEESTF